ncbi:hypothetical protein SK128_012273 [Halocaridina rubra]|uniref:Uncharacterized protein n=1 Tax=Halocaridina rubra TaxID=373956 RepID=A0AAN9ABU4_HALRR
MTLHGFARNSIDGSNVCGAHGGIRLCGGGEGASHITDNNNFEKSFGGMVVNCECISCHPPGPLSHARSFISSYTVNNPIGPLSYASVPHSTSLLFYNNSVQLQSHISSLSVVPNESAPSPQHMLHRTSHQIPNYMLPPPPVSASQHMGSYSTHTLRHHHAFQHQYITASFSNKNVEQLNMNQFNSTASHTYPYQISYSSTIPHVHMCPTVSSHSGSVMTYSSASEFSQSRLLGNGPNSFSPQPPSVSPPLLQREAIPVPFHSSVHHSLFSRFPSPNSCSVANPSPSPYPLSLTNYSCPSLPPMLPPVGAPLPSLSHMHESRIQSLTKPPCPVSSHANNRSVSRSYDSLNSPRRVNATPSQAVPFNNQSQPHHQHHLSPSRHPQTRNRTHAQKERSGFSSIMRPSPLIIAKQRLSNAELPDVMTPDPPELASTNQKFIININ